VSIIKFPRGASRNVDAGIPKDATPKERPARAAAAAPESPTEGVIEFFTQRAPVPAMPVREFMGWYHSLQPEHQQIVKEMLLEFNGSR
jgi:hypothetical protein